MVTSLNNDICYQAIIKYKSTIQMKFPLLEIKIFISFKNNID